jgi:hypothetical protein
VMQVLPCITVTDLTLVLKEMFDTVLVAVIPDSFLDGSAPHAGATSAISVSGRRLISRIT